MKQSEIIYHDKEASEVLGENCYVCIQCGATATGTDKVIHNKTCAPPDPKWFEEIDDDE